MSSALPFIPFLSSDQLFSMFWRTCSVKIMRVDAGIAKEKSNQAIRKRWLQKDVGKVVEK